MTIEKKRGGLTSKGKVSRSTRYKQTEKKSQLKRKAESKRMYDMALAGKTHSEISEKFGFASVTVQRRIADFREEHDLPMPKPRGRPIPKKLEVKQIDISFDFDRVRKRLINTRTIFNVDGIYQAGLMLKCLEICPFVDVVAKFLERSRFDVYSKLRYYLTEDEFQKLLKTLKVRRKDSSKSDCKQDLESKITDTLSVKAKVKKVVRVKKVKKVKKVKVVLSLAQEEQIKNAKKRIKLARGGFFKEEVGPDVSLTILTRIVRESKDEIKQVKRGEKVEPKKYKHRLDKKYY